jgi:hypothetical protein
MSFGAEIRNDYAIQLSDTVPNYCLRGTVVPANFATAGPFSTASLVALRSTTFASQFWPTSFDSSAYVFSPASEFSPSTSGFAMETYNASGELCFTSLRHPLVVVEYIETNDYLQKVYTPGRSYAVIPLSESLQEHSEAFIISYGNAQYYVLERVIAFKIEDHVVTFDIRARTITEGTSSYLSGSEEEGWAPLLPNGLDLDPVAGSQQMIFGQPTMRALIVDITNA